MAELSVKERKFIAEYRKHGVGSKAAIAAGYAESSAAVTASKLLKKPNVAREMTLRDAQSQKKAGLSADLVVETLSNLVSFDIASLYDKSGKLLNIHEMPVEARNAIASIEGDKVKLISRLGSLELATKVLGMVKDQQDMKAAVQIIIGQRPELPVVSVEQRQLLPEWE